MAYRIVILDGKETNPGDLLWLPIEKEGELKVFDDLIYDEEKIAERIGESEIVITVDVPITAAVMYRCRNIRYIGAMATGFNHISLAEAERRGIAVTNVPSYSTSSVSQRAIALLMELSDRVGTLSGKVKNGEWAGPFPHWEIPSFTLEGKTLGILGYGKIGRRTGEIALALGMKVIAYSRTRQEGWEGGIEFVSLSSLLTNSDCISLHAPLNEDSFHIIRKENIEMMKYGAYIINTSRGALIDEKDLNEALESRKLGGAALDVLETEPPEKDNPLLSSPYTIVTPHTAWTGKEARRVLIEETGKNIQAWKNGEWRNRLV